MIQLKVEVARRQRLHQSMAFGVYSNLNLQGKRRNVAYIETKWQVFDSTINPGDPPWKMFMIYFLEMIRGRKRKDERTSWTWNKVGIDLRSSLVILMKSFCVIKYLQENFSRLHTFRFVSFLSFASTRLTNEEKHNNRMKSDHFFLQW